MQGTKITGGENLVEFRIVPRTETYYLVTEDNLKSISGKNIFTDVFSLIASLLWGAFFSVFIAIRASSKLAEDAIRSLLIYQKVFLVAALIFTLLAAFFLAITHVAIAKIRKANLPKE